MNTLEEYWQKLRSCEKCYLTVEETHRLYKLLGEAKYSDIEYLKVIARRYLKAFVALAYELEELKGRELTKT